MENIKIFFENTQFALFFHWPVFTPLQIWFIYQILEHAFQKIFSYFKYHCFGLKFKNFDAVWFSRDFKGS